MDVINKKDPILLVLILLVACGNCFAQSKHGAGSNSRPRFYFDNPITLDSLTKYVHSHSKIRFSFNSSKVKGSKMINLQKGTYTLESLLQQIQKHTSLYYSIHNGYVIFQDNPPKYKGYNITLPGPRKTVAAHHTLLPKPNNKTNNYKHSSETKPLPVANTAPADTGKTTIRDTTISHDTTTISKDSKPVVPAKVSSQSKTSDIPGITTATAAKKNTAAIRSKNNSTGGNGTGWWWWQFGLQWKSAVPLYGGKYYFTGANASSQPYNVLIPCVWLSALFGDKHELMLLVKPAEWYDYNKKVVGVDSVYLGGLRLVKYTTLVKTSNLYASLQYNYHINERWTVGAGIGYHFSGKDLVYQQTFATDTFGIVSDTLYDGKSGGSIAGKYLASSFITGKAEVAYNFGSLSVGATLLMPLTKPLTDKSMNKSHPLNVQIFVRWKFRREEE